MPKKHLTIQLFSLKILNKVEKEGNVLKLSKASKKNLEPTSYNDEYKTCPVRSQIRQECPLSTSMQHCTRAVVSARS